MQFVVLGGAGIEGRGIVKDLVRSGVDAVVIADRDVGRAQSLAADLASDRTRVSAVQADADDHASLMKVMQNAGVVVSALGPFYRYGLKTVRAAIEARVPYVDINDDFDAIEAVLGLDAEARAAGIPVVVGLGVTPGVSNVCVKYAAGRMDRVRSVDIAYVGAAGVGGDAVFLHFFHSLCGPIPVLRDGKRIWVTPIAEAPKAIAFPAPFGTIQAPVIGHPEPIMLPRHIPGIESITVRGAVYPRVLQETVEKLGGLGLLSDRPVTLGDTTISPREFILACFDTHIETPEMLEQIAVATASLPSPVYGSLCIDVEGEQAGRPASRRFTIDADLCDATDWPASIGAQMLAAGEINRPGVLCPEQCVPFERLFAELKKRQIHIEMV
jgi:saccharopine dehydrogenase-like NADP-dependent oxidoreductase